MEKHSEKKAAQDIYLHVNKSYQIISTMLQSIIGALTIKQQYCKIRKLSENWILCFGFPNLTPI